jgi:hypothetical protein
MFGGAFPPGTVADERGRRTAHGLQPAYRGSQPSGGLGPPAASSSRAAGWRRTLAWEQRGTRGRIDGEDEGSGEQPGGPGMYWA